MTGSQTPSTAQLMDWLEDRLPVEERAWLDQAVEAAPMLREHTAWLRQFLEISGKLILADPPEDVHRSAQAAFAAYVRANRPPGILQRLSAVLASDNWQQLSLAGVRNVTLHTAPRQLIFTSDLADVALNLRLESGGQQIDLAGQVFPLDDTDPTGFVVQLLQDDVDHGLAACDAMGRFSLAGLPAGTYDMVVSGERGEIELGPIDLA